MGIYIKELKIEGYERVIEIQDAESSLHAFIAVHDTTLGPALGGTRMIPYPNREEALEDVLRLSKGMTFKSTDASLPVGGGKSVINIDPKVGKTEALLKAFGEALNYLGGIYYCAEDMGCTPQDLEVISSVSNYVMGCSQKSGDPSRFTAWGVFKGIEASAMYLWGSPSVKGKNVLVQGIGGVGAKVLQHLFFAGANLLISDINEKALAWAAHEYTATIVPLEDVYKSECDIFVPCARGGILSSETIPQLRCKIVAGGANNQLLEEKDAYALKEKNILYAPDYVINSGGVISIASEFDLENNPPKVVLEQTNKIYDRLLDIYKRAEKEDVCTATATDKIVTEKLQSFKDSKDALV